MGTALAPVRNETWSAGLDEAPRPWRRRPSSRQVALLACGLALVAVLVVGIGPSTTIASFRDLSWGLLVVVLFPAVVLARLRVIDLQTGDQPIATADGAATIVRRGKQGFGVPFDRWFRGPLASVLRDVLAPGRLRRAGLFDAVAVGTLGDEHISGVHNHDSALWSLLVFELWRAEYLGKSLGVA